LATHAHPISATGVVLAGGRSARFGRDKLAEPLAGRPLLHHAVRAVAAVCREVLVVTAPDGPAPDLPTVLTPVRTIPDPEPYGGPLVALGAALAQAQHPLVLVAAGDMPSLVPGLLREMLRVAEANEGEAVVLLEGTEVRPLPCVIRAEPARAAANGLLASGERSLRGLLDGLSLRPLSEPEWRMFDPNGRTLLDVDRPGDFPPE
jgi:molybdopterin-guanine dinucleotide biosynthesis protein A